MFLVEENNKTLLMTGDGHSRDILKGLKAAKRLDANGGLHVDILKVQHHGSEHNIDKDFTRVISADNYIFCGNGSHTNPPKTGVPAKRRNNGDQNINGKNNRSLTLWFNSDDSVTKSANKGHMKKVEDLVKSYPPSKVKFKFMQKGKSFMDLTL
jgi:beta-lactamase superfamily II metal-dependent hydrolase